MIELKELKIPVWSILVTILLIIIITVLVVRFNAKIREKDEQYKNKFDSVTFVSAQILQQKDDTISYLKGLIVSNDIVIAKNKQHITHLNELITTISSEVTHYTTSECYELINAKIEPKDTLVYKFSDNQVREVCDLVETSAITDTILMAYKEYTFSLEASIELKDREISTLEDMKKLLSDQVKSSSEIIEKVEKKLKRNKIIRNIAIGAVPVALVVGVCL